MEWTDAAAVEHARGGNADAFRVLVDRHSRAVFRLAYRMTGNEHDAEDMVQETFLRAYKQLGKFDGRAGFGTWLYRIASNCSVDLIRARKKREERTVEAPVDGLRSREAGPERLTQSLEISGILGSAMNELSATERTAFVLRHYEGLGMDEIGGVLGVEANAAKHSVFRAVQKLRRALQPAMGAAR